jgi:tetratricopeptide (TPR) repeat protein
MHTRLLHRLGVVGAVGLFGLAVSVGPAVSVIDDRGTSFPPPQPEQKQQGGKQKSQKKKKKDKQSEQQLRDGYQRALALITGGQYEAGIAAMHALGHGDNPDIANAIGFASRKLGRYQDSQFWYEKALAADPNHVRTWSYYGMWHAEQGNVLMAQDYLQKVKLICGNETCEEFVKLKGVIEGTTTY